MKPQHLPLLLRRHAVGTFGGVLVAAGLIVTAVAWTGIRTADNVPAQMPVVLSGGLVALACFIVGAMLIHAEILTSRTGAEAPLPGTALNGTATSPEEEARRRAAILARR